MSVGCCLNGIPADVYDRYKHGSNAGAFFTKAVFGKQSKGKACFAGNIADSHGDYAQKDVSKYNSK